MSEDVGAVSVRCVGAAGDIGKGILLFGSVAEFFLVIPSGGRGRVERKRARIALHYAYVLHIGLHFRNVGVLLKIIIVPVSCDN